MREVITVSQLNRYVKSLLESDRALGGLMVSGEISNFTRHYQSGHLYFTLKDKSAAVKAVMFRSHAQQLQFAPESGMSVIVSGYVTLYEQAGNYQVYVTDMQPDGVGALYLAYEQRKARLEREGLFDQERKRSLPRYPSTIGIVTSAGAAALSDVLNILSRRWPCARVVLSAAQVQGDDAPRSLIAALRALDSQGKCDVIIIGRGGGSIEDLWAFNDEKLAREIAACKTPVISAVGHETDFTIADFAADVRAPTPSAAAELAAPDIYDVRQWMDSLSRSCQSAVVSAIDEREYRLRMAKVSLRAPKMRVKEYGQRLRLLKKTLELTLTRQLDTAASRLQASRGVVVKSSENAVENARQRRDTAKSKLQAQIESSFRDARYRLERLKSLTEDRSPIRLLERGYSRTTNEHGHTIFEVGKLSVGQMITTRLSDGELVSKIERIRQFEQDSLTNKEKERQEIK